jgi:hypothetical protein
VLLPAFAFAAAAFAGALRLFVPNRLNPEELFAGLFALGGALAGLFALGGALAGLFALGGALEGSKLFKKGTFCATVFAVCETELNMFVAAFDTAFTVPAAALDTAFTVPTAAFTTAFTAPTAPEESGEDISLPCCARLISI